MRNLAGSACKSRKVLSQNGSLYETVCVKSICWKNGLPCPDLSFDKIFKHLPVKIECKKENFTHFNVIFRPVKDAKKAESPVIDTCLRSVSRVCVSE